VLLLGVTLVSGALGGATYGKDPVLGVLLGLATSVAYAGLLLVLPPGQQGPAAAGGPSAVGLRSAAVTSLVAGGGARRAGVPGLEALGVGWAVAGHDLQCAGWCSSAAAAGLPRPR
jgi:hypothetical protein